MGRLYTKWGATCTNIAAKPVVVAANATRPVPETNGKWYWSQQNITDQYQYRSKTGSGRSERDTTSTRNQWKPVVVEGERRE